MILDTDVAAATLIRNLSPMLSTFGNQGAVVAKRLKIIGSDPTKANVDALVAALGDMTRLLSEATVVAQAAGALLAVGEPQKANIQDDTMRH